MRQNCLFTYYSYAFTKFGFDPDANNFIFTTLPNGNVGYILPEEFKLIQNNIKIRVPFHLVTMDEFAKVMESLFPKKKPSDYQKSIL